MSSFQTPRPCHFLSIPRELRDAIYELTLTPSLPLRTSKKRVRCHLQNAPNPQMRLLNRQIKDEYDSRTKFQTRILLADQKFFDFSTIKLPPFPSFRSISIRIFATCDECNESQTGPCAAADQMQRYRAWFANLLETLPKEFPLRLEVSVWSDGEHELGRPDGYDMGHCGEATVQVRSLAGLPGVTSTIIYQSEGYRYDVFEGFREGLLCAQWEEAGW